MRAQLRLPLAAVVVVLALVIPPAGAQPYSATIWNGQPTPAGTQPAVAALGRPDSTAPVDCSGTLVHPRWVLTAAHCIFDIPAARLLIGLDGVDVRDGFREVLATRQHVVHPSWNPRTVRYDAALVRLPRRSTVVPMPLAADGDATLAAPGSQAQIVGWGATDGRDRASGRLREALITMAADRDCEGAHDNYHRASMLCGSAAEADACRGDSGGPLFAVTEEQRVVLGVTSFGDDCDQSVVGVYARVPAIRAWIDEVVAAGRVPAFRTDAGLVTSADRIRPGRAVIVRAGLFRYSDGAPLFQQKVEILRRRRGTTTWRVAARRTTNLNGLVRFRDEPRRDMQYRLRHRATTVTKASQSPARTVRVVR